MLTWSRRFHLRVLTRSSMWLIPLGFILLSIALSVLMPWLDRHVASEPPFTYSASSAQTTLSAIASGMLVFTGFVFSILTFAIQFGASTFTPRLIRTVATDTTTKISLGVFIATFIYALLLLAEIAPGENEYVPQYSVLLSVVLVGVSILLFLALIASVTGSIRPGRLIATVSRQGRTEIAAAFPEPARAPSGSAITDTVPETASRYVSDPEQNGGVLQAVHVKGIVALADELGVTAVLVPAVGDYVPTGAPVFRVYGGEDSANVERLLDSVALGDERTFRQDPSYAFRILVDIAIRALSPAVNDPSTAVEVLGRIEDLLLMLGSRQLPDGVYKNGDGDVRFIYRRPTWSDFLSLAFTEIRTYGADSPLLVDELHRIISGLRELAPEWRRNAIDHQLALLEAAVDKANR